MKDWLLNRLAGGRVNAKQWRELARALELFWDTHYEPVITRIADSRSLFTASDADLELTLKDLGEFFNVNMPLADVSKPLAVAWRRNEIHLKSTSIPISSIIGRNYDGLEVRWEELYAPIHGQYDTLSLLSAEEIKKAGHDMGHFFMTSRGRLWANKGQFLSLGISQSEFRRAVRAEIAKIRPVHIVYEGEYFVLNIEVDVPPLSVDFDHDTSQKNYLAQLPEHLVDYQRIHSIRTYDAEHIPTVNESSYPLFDDIPADFCSLDMEMLNF